MLRLCIRNLHTTRKSLNRGPIPKPVFSQLQDTTKLHLNNDIVILNPSKSRIRRPKLFKNTKESPIPSFVESSKSQVFNLEKIGDQEDTDYIDLIKYLKPNQSQISENKYKQISDHLVNSFTSTQLKNYVKQYYKKSDFKGNKVGLSRRTKVNTVDHIISDLWNIKRTGKINDVNDLYSKETRKLKSSEMFLLLSKDGFLIRYLQKTGCQVDFNVAEKTLNFTGYQDKIDSANIVLDSILNKIVEKTVDLSLVKRLYGDKFDIQRLSSLCQVYFQHVENDIYTICALNNNQINRAKRLIMWQLNYTSHAKQFVHLPSRYNSEPLTFLPYKDDDALCWFERLENLSTLSAEGKPHSRSKYIEDQLARFDDESLLQHNSLDLDEINEIKSMMTSPDSVNSSQSIEELSQEILTDEETDLIYEKLTDFSVEEDSIGPQQDQLTDPLLVVSLGKILFSNPSDSKLTLPTSKYDNNIPSDNLFNTNVPMINDKLLSLPFFHNPQMTARDINNYRFEDPHDYIVQIKFQPSLFDNQNIKAPSLEMIFNLNKFGTPEMETFKVFAVQNENSCMIPMPDKAADIRVTSQVLGDLFPSTEVEQSETTLDEIQAILSERSKKYSQFNDPGLEEFLQKSNLTFHGSSKPKIYESLEINIGGCPVKYNYISLSYIKQLEFLYKDKLLQLNLIEAGGLGGHRSEVTLCGDELDKTTFKQLIKDSVLLIDKAYPTN